MDLTTLVQLSAIPVLARSGSGNPEIRGICADSRQVQEGDLFVAVPGTRVAGDSFVAEAVAHGAVAVVSEKDLPQCTVPCIKTERSRFALGALAVAFWRLDVEQTLFIGITGTNGKTTTAHLFKNICAARFGVDAVWMFGTIEYHLGIDTHPASHTTPETLTIARLAGTATHKPKAVVMEVSSHALALDRVGGLRFDLAAFTNLTQDHLDFHKSMEDYYQAKKRLFTGYLKRNGRCAINVDDPWGRRLAGELPSREIVTFGKASDAVLRIAQSSCTWEGTEVDCVVGGRTVHCSSRLRGDFNVYNLSGAIAGALALGVDETTIRQAVSGMATVPGRMEPVPLAGAPFTVIVDYAHTPDALVNILQTSRKLTKGKIICVFGCGGDRDRTKRALMGAAVAANSDEAVVTSDNPRSELPMAIIEEILDGMPLDFPHWVIPDRRRAIDKALAIAGPGDCVVVAGKGHETYQEIKGVRYPFDDRTAVADAYAQRGRERHG